MKIVEINEKFTAHRLRLPAAIGPMRAIEAWFGLGMCNPQRPRFVPGDG